MTQRTASFFAALSIVGAIALASTRIAASAVPPTSGGGGAAPLAGCTETDFPALGQGGTLSFSSFIAWAGVAANQPSKTVFNLVGTLQHTNAGQKVGTVTFAATIGGCKVVWTYVGVNGGMDASSHPPTLAFTHYESLSHAASAVPASTATPGGPPHP
jgi:hypothetical protein